jgi:uncharacterized LabA/DUF88 family protein
MRPVGICAVFLDAGYVERVLIAEHDGSRIDYGLLAKKMAGGDRLRVAYYYNCLPYLSDTPTTEEQLRYDKKRRFMDALSRLPQFNIRLGELALIEGAANGKRMFQQKRVDMMLGIDMVLVASKKKVTSVALFSGDSDYVPVVQTVRSEGVKVTLWHGSTVNRPSIDLARACDTKVELTAELVSELLRQN